MTYLLDSHTYLWFCQNDPKLSANALVIMRNIGNTLLLSVASCWEIAIKAGLGKWTLGEPSASYVTKSLSHGFQLLPISLDDATAVEHLPHHHRDPFDRILVAQAKALNFPIISVDAILDAYGVSRIW